MNRRLEKLVREIQLEHAKPLCRRKRGRHAPRKPKTAIISRAAKRD